MKEKLIEREKKLLTILHEARLVEGKFLKDYEKMIRKYFSFSYKELHEAIKRFLLNNLLKEIKLKDNEVMYFWSSKVTSDMLNEKLSEVGINK